MKQIFEIKRAHAIGRKPLPRHAYTLQYNPEPPEISTELRKVIDKVHQQTYTEMEVLVECVFKICMKGT